MMSWFRFGMSVLVGRTYHLCAIQRCYRILTCHCDQWHITVTQCNPSLMSYCSSRKVTPTVPKRKHNTRDQERMQYLQSIFADCVQKYGCRYLTAEEWDDILKQSAQDLRIGNVPLRLYELLVFVNDLNASVELIKSLRDYIVNRGIKHSPLALSTGYMVLLSKQREPNTLDELLSIYDQIRQQYEVLDAKSINEIILSLVHTPRWKDCFELLDMMQISASPSAVTYGNIIIGALLHGDFAVAYEMLEVMHQKDLDITDMVYEAFLADDDESSVERFLNYLKAKGIIPSSKAASLIKDWFQRQYEKEYTVKCNHFLSKTSDVCPHCNISLEPLEPVPEQDFEEMRQAFIDQVLHRKGDVYLNTTPQELDTFTKFLHDSGHFDVVIDALNVSYNTKKKVTVKERAAVVESVVRYFVKREMRICLISKKHTLKSWPKVVLNYITDNATCFYTSNISEDDLFMLHAVMHSGLGTYFVTRDELRDHCFLLPQEQRATFKHWQLQHQIVYRGKTYNKLVFRWPPKHKTSIQVTPNGWHIPYEDQELREDFKPPHSWLCLQKLDLESS